LVGTGTLFCAFMEKAARNMAAMDNNVVLMDFCVVSGIQK